MKKLKLLSLLAAMLFATSTWAADPFGCVDVVQGLDGSIYIEGWAIDEDAPNATLAIHVYMYKQGVAEPVLGEGNTVANVERPDLASFNCGTKHGFKRYISTENVAAGNYWINVFAINASGTAGGNVMLHAAIPDTQVDFHFTLKSPFTISYNANGGSGAPASQQKRNGININLQGKGNLARTGYTPDGWATSAGGNKAYDFGASYSGNASTTLYAHWNLVNYTISYTLNGGSVSGNPTSYNITTSTITLKNPTRTGYTFKGWTGSNGNTPQTTVTINKGSTGNKSYTANWTPVSYTVTYDLAGGAVASSNPTSYTIETATFTLNNPVREGYTFAGWTGSNGNTPQTSVSVAKGSTGNKSYKANWTPVNYTVTYDLAGGEIATANPTSYTIETATFTLNNPTRDGYAFLGWTGSNGENPQTEVSITKGSTGDKSYKANWKADPKPCGLAWMNVPEGGVVGTIGHEDEISLPQIYANQDFINAFSQGTVTLRLGSTNESVLVVNGFNNFEVKGVGECDVYAVHDADEAFLYDSVAFHVTVNPEPVVLIECGLAWMNVPEGGVVGTIGHEDEISLPQIYANQDFINAFSQGTVTLRLGSTNESVLVVNGFNNFEVKGVGECDVYAVHDADEAFLYDSVAFHVTVNPEPTPGPAPTVWTALKVGDVIKVGDKIEVPNEGDGSWGINGNVLRNAWGPYELIRADIYQASESDDPVVTETENGAFYVFKAENSDFYPLSNLGKSGGLVVTETSDGLVVTAAENKEFTVAVHDKGDTPTGVENVQGNKEQAIKLFRDGQLYIQREGVLYTVQGARVR